MSNWSMPCRLITVLSICASIVCGEHILPQLVAQIASFDSDHRVSLHANGEGVDLVLSHNDPCFTENEDALGSLSTSEPAHVVHIVTGSTTAKESLSLMVSKTRDLVSYSSTTVVSVWRTFVPPLPLAYSRPPPDEISVSPLDSSTLLLI
jgi:hypothetical protein